MARIIFPLREPAAALIILPPSITFTIMAMAILSVVSIVALLCGSESRKSQRLQGDHKTVRLGDCKKNKNQISRLQSNFSDKALLLAKMISWRKVQDELGEDYDHGNHYYDAADDDDEEAVWRKTIIKGEKCRPLDFSGKILYDSNGNLIPEDLPQPSK